jgi:hypothetical protein
VSDATAEREGRFGPFAIFGIALLVGAAFAIYEGVAYAATPTFVEAALPTVLGVSAAVAAILVIGRQAPPND